jgi:hypothetical protein
LIVSTVKVLQFLQDIKCKSFQIGLEEEVEEEEIRIWGWNINAYHSNCMEVWRRASEEA